MGQPSDFLPSARFGAGRFPDDIDRNDYTWEDYDKDVKKKYPFKYWINKTIFDSVGFFIYCWKRRFSDAYYWVRTHTFDRYHLIDIRQSQWSSHDYKWGWIEPDEQLLLANYKILCDFIDKSVPKDYFESTEKRYDNPDDDYAMDREYLFKVGELEDCYGWWRYGRKEYLGYVDSLFANLKSAKTRAEYNELSKKWIQAGKDFEKREEEMLVRLIRARDIMWT